MKISPSVAIILGLFPLLAQADISVTNNTSSYITAKVSIFCSDIAGDKGTIKPHSPFTVPQSIIDDYCKSGCEVKAYASKTCSGDAIATATIDQKNGMNGYFNITKLILTKYPR